MKRTILGVLAIAVIALIAQYIKMDKSPDKELDSNAQALAILESGQCLVCHSQNPELPFYASLPFIGEQVKYDAAFGVQKIDLTEAYNALASGGKVNEADLAKIEFAISDGSMPPAKYYAVHWGSKINCEEKEMMLNWAKNHRAQHYSLGTNAPEFANEPVQAIPEKVDVNLDKVAVGFKLYHDTRLSSDNTISCASCHGLNTGGVDNNQFSKGVDGQLGGVNAPTTFNATHNFVQFWDGRAETLAQQAAGPPLNPVEMASTSWEQIIEKLESDKQLTKEFIALYPEGYSEATITNAIEEFEKTLITPNSKFDKYLKGDKEAITAEERAGYEVFKRYECATCHVGVNLGGQTYEKLGLHADYFGIREIITDGDLGRFVQTQNEIDKHRFKVPTLRNIALTWPYFHDGSLNTMEEAVNEMVLYQVGKTFSDEERIELIAFLNTLTGEYQGKPLTNDNKQ